MRQFFSNIAIWFSGFGKGYRFFRSDQPSDWNEFVWYGYWFFDVGLNVLTGGDPEESISSRIHKDRHALFPKILIRLLEKLDARHGDFAVNTERGEGAVLNRELSNRGQVISTAALCLVLAIIGTEWPRVALWLIGGWASALIGGVAYTGLKREDPDAVK